MTTTSSPVPATPVVVGIAQFTELLGEPDYRGLVPVELAAHVARQACADAGIGPELLDVIACPRQFDETWPGTRARLGRPTSFVRAVASRLGADRARTIYSVSGGQSPQALITELAGAIASGRIETAIVVSAEAISTVLDLAKRPEPPDLTEDNGIDPGDRGTALEGIVTEEQIRYPIGGAPGQYALLENARRRRLGQTRAEQAAEIGAWFAPFTEIAAANPYAVDRRRRTAAELTEVTTDNRMIATPYPKAVVAREKVNQGAAVVLMSERRARELRIDPSRWSYLHGHSELKERHFLARHEMGRAPMTGLGVRTALEMAGIGLDDLAWMDFYSCFPIAVSSAADELGLRPDDPRGLTVTGGLPYFGGPGNGYSLHAIAEVVARSRRSPDSFGLVAANGGILNKYAVGVYSGRPAPWREAQDRTAQQELDALPVIPVVPSADGPALLESWTTAYTRKGRHTIVVGSLPDGTRCIANGVDEALDERLAGDDVADVPLRVRSTETGNEARLG